MTQPSTPLPSTGTNTDHVRDLARFVALPLAPEREAGVAAILNAWIPDALALNEKMSAAMHQALIPATIFTHPGTAPGEVPA